MTKSIIIDARNDVAKNITISFQVKNMWVVELGLWFVKVGCWIGGFSYVNEFPMSLYQTDKDAK